MKRLKTILVCLLVALLGAAAGAWSYREEWHAKRRDLLAEATKCALAFDAAELEGLSATSADLPGAAYARIKQRLMRLRGSQPAARFLYLLRHDPVRGSMVFLADSEPETSKYLSLPGDVYPWTGRKPHLQALVSASAKPDHGPVLDTAGAFVSAYLAVGSGPGAEVLGLDVEAREWSRQLWLVAFRSALLTWLCGGILSVAVIWNLQRSAREALIRKLYGAVEQSESATMIVSLQSRIEYVNAGLCGQTGYTREELHGRSWWDFRSEKKLPVEIAEIVARVKAGYSWEGQVTNSRKSGEKYPARAVVSPVRGAGGKVVGFIAVFTDVSELHRKEQLLREAKDQAETADHAKGRFLATMSHEVRTPLNGIVGFTSLLLDTALTPEQREYVQTIRTSGEALVQLTGDILDFSRIESGRLQLDAAPCDLRANLEDALDVFASRAADNGVQLLHSVDHDVPDQLMVDGGRLRQVMINLVGNAVKFTAAGEIEVAVRKLTGKSVSVAPFENAMQGQLVAEFDDGALTLEFSVRDTGVGISPTDCARLFQPFTQLDSSNMRRFGGAGLGLAISRHLVRLMGGDIRVESEPGRGSTFIFTVRARAAGVSSSPQPVRARLSGRRVALVTTHPGLRSEIAYLLRHEGAKVLDLTFERLTDKSWDLAVVDSDPAVTRGLRTGDAGKNWQPQRMFGLTAINLGPQERQALRRHFHMLLSRPVHHRTLIDLLVKAAEGLSGQMTASPVEFKGLRVLVVEDEPVLQRLVGASLTTLGCECGYAPNGRICVEALGSGDYDVVFMDAHMPEMDGLTAVKQIRSGEAGAQNRCVWITTITADHRPEMKEMAVAAGADDYLVKPIGLTEVEIALQRFLRARKAAADLVRV